MCKRERQYKMPINIYCCEMKVWNMQREGTKERAVTCFIFTKNTFSEMSTIKATFVVTT